MSNKNTYELTLGRLLQNSENKNKITNCLRQRLPITFSVSIQTILILYFRLCLKNIRN